MISKPMNLDDMKPMQRHRYISENSAECPVCKKIKKLRSFWVKESNTVETTCNNCAKQLYEAEVRKIVLNMLTKTEI